jgi:hypothetical protein
MSNVFVKPPTDQLTDFVIWSCDKYIGHPNI